MMFYAHRGAYRDAVRENTLAAFVRAHREGYDGIELDVRFTQDRRVVVSHDDSLQRVFGLSTKVRNTRLADLEALGLPSLATVAAYAREVGLLLVVDLKASSRRQERKLARAVADHVPPDTLVLFWHRGHAHDPNVPYRPFRAVRGAKVTRRTCATLAAEGYAGVAGRFESCAIAQKSASTTRAHGLALNIYQPSNDLQCIPDVESWTI